MMQFVVSKPSFLFWEYNTQAVDSGALAKSLKLNGVSFDPTISGEWTMVVSGEYVRIDVNGEKKSFQLVLDADKYNSLRTTKFRFPRDIILKDSSSPKSVSIVESGLPRDKTYNVSMYGYPGLDPDNINWYINTNPDTNCEIADVWNSLNFSRLKTKRISRSTSGQIELATYTLDYDTNLPRVCIIAWVGGDFQAVVDRSLSTFTATGSIVDMLSPEYDMKSIVEFRFSSDIYTDTGVLYSPEYMKNRNDAKIALLKQLEIIPAIPLTEANISFTPDRVSIIGDFQEWQSYNITIREVPDIYGRKITTNMNFLPVQKPFLSIWLESRRTIFRSGEPIQAKLYSLKTPKNTYTLKLCQISLEWYARAERIVSEWKKEYTQALYDLLSSSETSSCLKKDVVIASGTMISSFDVREFSQGRSLQPGLYILAFRNSEDVTGFERFVSPRVFSVIDSHITMKVDASGKMSFLVTDINTGKPLPNQSVTLAQNVTKTYTEEWNQTTQKYTVNYLPISRSSFSTGVSLGITDGMGFLSAKKDKLKEDEYNSPYSLSHEYLWEEYEGGYHSFLATSGWDGHFWYVVSTWNDGITGWNFWLKDSDYSWETRPVYSAYVHTDRRLYLPWEKVYVHAILRKNDSVLTIPKDISFVVQVNDPMGVEVKKVIMKPNDFGTISFDFILDKESMLWAYNVNITPFSETEQYEYISNGYTSFQVEIFKNPTFTANVVLKSPDIDADVVSNLRKKVNADPANPWYSDVYTSVIALEWFVKAHYYNGVEMRGVPFSYRIYRSQYFPESYWRDCFWGCYYEPSPEFYTEGTGSIDSEGLGFFRIPVDFSSYYNDYMYTAEVTITDPMTGEQVVTPGTLLAKMPSAYKSFAFDNPVVFSPVKKIVKSWEKIVGSVSPQYWTWDISLQGRYTYELVHRMYESVKLDDLRLSETTISVTRDIVVSSGVLASSWINLETRWLAAWEYHVKIRPKAEGITEPPESSVSDTLLYIAGDFDSKDTQLRVIPEKTVYRIGEKARVFITTPFTGGYLYITRERWWVIDYEYTPIQGNSVVREYTVDDTSMPNVYIGVVAFPGNSSHGMRSYAVGYWEIVTDMTDKKAKIQVTTNKDQYINREQVNVDLALTDKFGNPLQWEMAIMVVDESLIRLLGNIDLDIIPKFFQKFPFTIKTSLTSIGMERNRFLSRKWANGGSGDKGGWWMEIASRILFKNTAYYNPSIVTDSAGRAKASFVLPDNVTDYRIILIGQTQASHFWVAEKTINVRRDYTLESHIPYIAYPGDTTTITASAFNSTKKITQASIILSFGTGSSVIKKEQAVILAVNESKSVDFTFSIPDSWKWNIPYTISLVEQANVLDSLTKNLAIPDIPLLESTHRIFGYMTGSELTLQLPESGNVHPEKSKVTLRVASSFLLNADSIVKTLIQYPYGCIEQTIASTLPNAFALKFQSLLGTVIDGTQAKNNLDAGIKKILRMQHYSWGWKYWESDDFSNDHVTPYILRSLFVLRDLWFDIPQTTIDNGVNFIVNLLDNGESMFLTDPDFRAEVFWTLARAKNERASTLLRDIDPAKLSRHGYIAYVYGLHYLGKVTDELMAQLDLRMKQSNQGHDYWYWDSDADTAIYASLLLDRWKVDPAVKLLDSLIRDTDMSSYFVSTQTKIQALTAIIKESMIRSLKTKVSIAARSDGLIADMSLSSDKTWQKLDTNRSKIGNEQISLKKDSPVWVYYELLIKDVPKNILQTESISKGNIQVNRIIEKIDESRWVNSHWEFISANAVNDWLYQRGSLYRVTLKVALPDFANKSWHHLTVEDFVPGGWRPIRWIFKTESILMKDHQNPYAWTSWSHVEAKNDRILATAEWWYGDKQSYTYYFRPEYTGTYLLPPVTAYFMYRPEVFSLGKYEKITVK